MSNQFFANLRSFIEAHKKDEYKTSNLKINGFQYSHLLLKDGDIQLDLQKGIVLEEETKLELGGMNKTSFCLIYPTLEIKLIQDGKIHLFGPEITDIKENIIDFGIFILIGINKISDKLYNEISSLNFVSNSIKGFQIRSVPRKFWCRISAELIKKGFNFSLFGEALIYLYKQKYKHIVKAIEIFIISKNSSLINEFINISKPLYEEFRQKIRRRVEKWAKRVDCEYNWGCDVCPYQEECYKIKQTLIKREEL